MSLLAELPLLPWAVALPLGGAALVFVVRPQAQPIGLAVGLASAAVGLLLALQVATGGAQHHAVGGWGAPLGIDLAVVMLLMA